jgi:hypothetical protein
MPWAPSAVFAITGSGSANDCSRIRTPTEDSPTQVSNPFTSRCQTRMRACLPHRPSIMKARCASRRSSMETDRSSNGGSLLIVRPTNATVGRSSWRRRSRSGSVRCGPISRSNTPGRTGQPELGTDDRSAPEYGAPLNPVEHKRELIEVGGPLRADFAGQKVPKASDMMPRAFCPDRVLQAIRSFRGCEWGAGVGPAASEGRRCN